MVPDLVFDVVLGAAKAGSTFLGGLLDGSGGGRDKFLRGHVHDRGTRLEGDRRREPTPDQEVQVIGLKQGREPRFDLLAVSLGIRYLVRAFAMIHSP